MSTLLFVGLLLINLVISWWNAKVCGTFWSESKALGGFPRLLMWCGAIQSAIGFSMVILFGLVFTSLGLGYLTPKAAEAAFSLWYLAAIFPCIGTGIVITVHSWAVAWRERNWQSMGAAAWNTFATGHNIYSAASGGVSSAFSKVGDLFKGNDSKEGAAAKLVILLVVVAILGGVLLTTWLIAKYDRIALTDGRQGGRMPA
ncbi:hypothetical protein EQ832_12090 [Pseudomonas sp. ALS1131]|nr:hypothetical protein [Pseudomonas sp. ALS1131]TRO38586.1 hypothetical protein EQ832_12090 [Pseudomonas sp. ALS1131]